MPASVPIDSLPSRVAFRSDSPIPSLRCQFGWALPRVGQSTLVHTSCGTMFPTFDPRRRRACGSAATEPSEAPEPRHELVLRQARLERRFEVVGRLRDRREAIPAGGALQLVYLDAETLEVSANQALLHGHHALRQVADELVQELFQALLVGEMADEGRIRTSSVARRARAEVAFDGRDQLLGIDGLRQEV